MKIFTKDVKGTREQLQQSELLLKEWIEKIPDRRDVVLPVIILKRLLKTIISWALVYKKIDNYKRQQDINDVIVLLQELQIEVGAGKLSPKIINKDKKSKRYKTFTDYRR